MNQIDYETALSEFLRCKGITRCPTAFVAPTRGTVRDRDRAALRSYEDAREAARLQKLVAVRSVIAPSTITPA